MSRLNTILTLSFVLLLNGQVGPSRFAGAEKAFAKARSLYPELTFVEGNDVTAPAGTVIFMSREEGIHRLVIYTRSGYPEISLLYAPKLDAWITMTIDSHSHEVTFRGDYLLATMLVEGSVEWWHTHNRLKEDATEWDFFDESMKWVMPSYVDLGKVYELGNEVSRGRITGHIAHPYGVTVFWRSKSRRPLSEILASFYVEATALREGVKSIPEQNIPAFVAEHREIFRLRYYPMP